MKLFGKHDSYVTVQRKKDKKPSKINMKTFLKKWSYRITNLFYVHRIFFFFLTNFWVYVKQFIKIKEFL